MPFAAKTDDERRVLINSIGPTWEGNQIWFITGGGTHFAAWPLVYSVAFSGFYWALLLVLFALFPFVMPSSTFPNASLTVYDAISSHRTLNLMFVAVVLFLPVVLLYTNWVYRVPRGKVTEKRIREETHSAY